MSDEHSKLEQEIRTAEVMIEIFCHGHHGTKEGLCPECRELLAYVTGRLERCPLQENKPKCSKCPVHCYKPAMREKIRAVMKYAGPRMLYRHPILAGRHYLKGK
ncbi:MAG: nitrous oxide-stimulated promoter family protein [Deltaproteobacteria bacterium]|nr:nitrous oxide-stimulated promoter family protein [Deltaproteobacteria bacterium]